MADDHVRPALARRGKLTAKTRKIMGVIAALCLIAAVTNATPAHLDVRPDDALVDEPVAIVLSGVAPGTSVTIGLRGFGDTPRWSSSATFVADASGTVDLTRMAPVRGDYEGASAMGLFWSARHDSSAPTAGTRAVDASIPPPQIWHVTASAGGSVLAEATVTRRAVAGDVTITAVHDRGLVGVFYRSPVPGRHPAILALSGSGGGVMPVVSHPGGLASRGYDVLALAYFGVAGLPPSLHDIPIEYFATALEWLQAQPSVDPQRVGVLGVSRGAELALLLGTIFPQIRSVVAYLPSDIVVGGCCTGRSEASWTIEGRPLAWSFPPARNTTAGERAAIRVERIHGAVLLISGRADQIWPSSVMSDEIVRRLERNHFAFPHEHLAYADAGHGIGRPYSSTMDINHVVHPLTGRNIALGGTPAGTAKAAEDSWHHLLLFLDENLRGKQ